MPVLPFTAFQTITRKWEEVCPQNSAHAMLVEGTADADLIESAWQSTLRDLGLGRVIVDDEQNGYWHDVWSGDPPAPLVSQISGGVDIYRYISENINRPFETSPALPYRAFAVEADGQFYLGIIYQQWVADSVSIRLLMREWFLRIMQPARARKKLIDLPKVKMARGPELGMSLRQLVGFAKLSYRWYKEAQTINDVWETLGAAAGDAPTTELHHLSLGSQELDNLLLVTRAEGCTLNDVLIGTMAHVIRHRLPEHNKDPIAIATSVDLRPYLPGDLSETFGSLLAYVPVLSRPLAGHKLDPAQEIARQTKRMKDPDYIGRYLALPRLFAWFAKRQSTGQLQSFHRRYARVAASVANVNLDKTWCASYHPSPLKAYIRLASPNPSVPVALHSSTLGNSMDVIITTRLPSGAGEEVAGDFARHLQDLVQSRP